MYNSGLSKRPTAQRTEKAFSPEVNDLTIKHIYIYMNHSMKLKTQHLCLNYG